MRRGALRIGAELVPVLMVVFSLIGGLALIVGMYRRQSAPASETPPVVASVEEPAPAEPDPEIDPEPVPPAPPPVEIPEPDPQPDPTAVRLAEIDTLIKEQKDAATQADERARALDAARERVSKRAASLTRRESLVQQQVARLGKVADDLERQADSLALARDVLAHRRDEIKEDLQLAEARAKDGVAVLPYKGSNGTWRVPIAVECVNGTVTLQPGGPTFSLLELSPLLSSARSMHPLARAVALRVMKAGRLQSPDGSAVVPYVLFVIRPDGVRPYYQARALLEPLGLVFGYELTDQSVQIEFPDTTDPNEWPGSGSGGTRTTSSARDVSSGGSGSSGEFVWPAEREEGVASGGSGSGGEFVWPTGPSGDGSGSPVEGSYASGDSSDRPGGLRSLDGPGRAGQPPESIDLSSLVEPPGRNGSGDKGGSRVDRTTSGGTWTAAGGSGDETASRLLANRGSQTDRTLSGAKPGSGGFAWPDSASGSSPARSPGMGNGSRGATSQPGSYARGGRSGDEYGRPRVLRPGGSVASGGGSGSRPSSAGDALDHYGSPIQGGSGRETSGSGRDTSGGGSTRPGGYHVGRSDGASGASRPGTLTVGLGSRSSSTSTPPPSGASPPAGLSLPPGFTPPPNLDASVPDWLAEKAGQLDPRLLERLARRFAKDGSKGSQSSAPSSTGNVSMSLGGSNDPKESKSSSIAPPESHYRKERQVEVVVACDPHGVVVNPGGYHISKEQLDENPLAVIEALEASVDGRRRSDPDSDWKPRVTFLVESGGSETFWKARRQTIFAGPSWPAGLQVEEAEGLRVYTREDR